MSAYAVIWLDHHADPEVTLFADRDKAIAWAAEQARDNDRHDTLSEGLTQGMQDSGWLYYGSYGADGDYLFVVERPVQT